MQRLEIDAEPRDRVRRERLEQHVGGIGEREERVAAFTGLQVEHRAALAAVPHAVRGLIPERLAARRLDLRDPGTVIGEEHAGDRPGGAPRQVEDVDALEHSGHQSP